MKIIIKKYSNGQESVSTGMAVDHAGQTVIEEREIEVQKSIMEGYFKNPDKYVIDFKKGEIHANTQ